MSSPPTAPPKSSTTTAPELRGARMGRSSALHADWWTLDSHPVVPQKLGLNDGVAFAVNTELDRIFYREIVRNIGVADGKVIRQRDGVGVYANVVVEVRALSREL